MYVDQFVVVKGLCVSIKRCQRNIDGDEIPLLEYQFRTEAGFQISVSHWGDKPVMEKNFSYSLYYVKLVDVDGTKCIRLQPYSRILKINGDSDTE